MRESWARINSELQTRKNDLIKAHTLPELIVAVDAAVHQMHHNKPMLAHLSDYLIRNMCNRGITMQVAKDRIYPVFNVINNILKLRDDKYTG